MDVPHKDGIYLGLIANTASVYLHGLRYMKPFNKSPWQAS